MLGSFSNPSCVVRSLRLIAHSQQRRDDSKGGYASDRTVAGYSRHPGVYRRAWWKNSRVDRSSVANASVDHQWFKLSKYTGQSRHQRFSNEYLRVLVGTSSAVVCRYLRVGDLSAIALVEDEEVGRCDRRMGPRRDATNSPIPRSTNGSVPGRVERLT